MNENVLAHLRRELAAALPGPWSALCAGPISVPPGNTYIADLRPSTMCYDSLRAVR